MTNKIENNAQEIKLEVAKQIKANTESITDYLIVFKKKVEMVEKITLTVSDSVETAHKIIADNKNNLVKTSDKADKNKESILINVKKQEDLEERVKSITDDRIHVCSHPSSGLMTGSSNVTIEDIMIGQY